MKEPFLFGASTSSHQVEGNNNRNDWWTWEQAHSQVENSGVAVDHWRLWKEDLALARSLSHSAHRFSLEWSRIEPSPGQWDTRALSHYREVLEELRALNMKSFVTLHHFTNPDWFAKRGGWLRYDAPELFDRYVKTVVEHLGDVVDFWITINEPMVYATQSFMRGVWPPQKRSLPKTLRVISSLAKAHKRAYGTIHRHYPQAKVGASKHLVAYLPEHGEQFDDRLVARLEDWWFNRRWFSLTGRTHDFIGVNFYFVRDVRVHVWPPSISTIEWTGARSDQGWPIRPDGLKHVLLEMRDYKLPIYVTENGLADASDSQRADFIRDHLRAVEGAQQEGADVRGYLHWSLLDNFEWADGFEPRFGLVEVDYTTMERKVRGSAYVYKAIIEQGQSN